MLTDDQIIDGMTAVISQMENYRALLEARGFSRWCAEAMTVQYHALICDELNRARIAQAKLLGDL